MLDRLIRRSGQTITTGIITAIIVLISSSGYLLASHVTSGITIYGSLLSILIPLVIVPAFSALFPRVVAHLYRSEAALMESEEKYRTILDSIEDGYFEVDIAGRLDFFNDSLCRILGYSRDELMGCHYRTFMDENNAAKVFQTFNRVFRTGIADKGFDWEIIKKDGNKRHLDASVSPKREKEGNVIGFQGVVRNVTARKISEKALRESEEKYRQLVDSAPAAICEIDVGSGKFISFNNVLCEYTGYNREELLSMKIADLLADDSRSRFMQRARQVRQGRDISGTVEYGIISRRGDKIWFMVNSRYFFDSGRATRVMLVAHNITDFKAAEGERHKLEEQLRQAQKMEAIGTLAAGIAHDFNNILSAVMGYVELSQLHVSRTSDVAHYLAKMEAACRQARELIRQIMAFSRQDDPEKITLSVESVINDALRFFSPSLPSEIHIRRQIHPASGAIDADPERLQQVLFNLFTNACHAMKPSGGIIEVRTMPVDVTRSEATAVPGLKAGPYVKISVSDTGKGMSKDVLERAFDPYYTTKQSHEGTGLGLAIVRNIVAAHAGAVSAESSPGQGSVFHVFLPRAPSAEPKRTDGVCDIQNDTQPIASGNERILFVDDEENIAYVGQELLEHIGYVVETQTSSGRALERFSADPFAFDLIITDMVMPGITGDLLSKKILAIRPDMPIIMCTGHSESISEETARSIGIRAFVTKPYRLREFAGIIRSVLDASSQ